MSTGTRLVIGAFSVSGVIHLVRPQVFEPLVPEQLGAPRPWVYGSGVLELVCAAGLSTRQQWAPALSTATLTGIWIGNVKMALDVQRSRRPTWQKAVVWARVPAQLPMLKAAWTSPTR